MNCTGIEYVDFTWNPITGCLMPESCAVRKHCFANRVVQNLRGQYGYDAAKPFKPTIHLSRINQPCYVKKPSRIFTCDMGDMWGDWVPEEWIETVMNTIRQCPQHTFLLLTKNPGNYEGRIIPSNCWLGTTVNRQDETDRIYEVNRVRTFERMDALSEVIRWISFEPLLNEINLCFNRLDIDWIVIGAQTKPNLQPKKEWVEGLIESARDAGIKVFLKNNLHWHEKIQEIPGRV